jgi:hypothetical protein
MPANRNIGFPKNAAEAKKRGYKKVPIDHATMGHGEKKKWALLKMPTSATGTHTVCYYDPGTGTYSDCHEESD